MEPIKNYQGAKRSYRHGVKTFYSDFHFGVDLVVPEGTEIYAPFDGYASRSRGKDAGNYVVLKFVHEGKDMVMRCLHLSKYGKEGAVKQGDIIGYSGNTGKSTAPHIHLDLWKQKVTLNNRENSINPDSFDWGKEQKKQKEKPMSYKTFESEEDLAKFLYSAMVELIKFTPGNDEQFLFVKDKARNEKMSIFDAVVPGVREQFHNELFGDTERFKKESESLRAELERTQDKLSQTQKELGNFRVEYDEVVAFSEQSKAAAEGCQEAAAKLDELRQAELNRKELEISELKAKIDLRAEKAVQNFSVIDVLVLAVKKIWKKKNN